MKKRSTKTTTTNQTQNLVTSPTNPEFVTSGIEGLAGKIGDFFGKFDPASLAPGPTGLQTQAATSAGGLATSPIYDQVMGAGPQSVGRTDIASLIPGLMNQFTPEQVDANLVNFDEGAGMTRAQNKLALAGDDTFGGSGGAIQTALSERGLAEDRTRIAADLRAAAFDRAAGLAGQQAGLDASRNLTNANFGEAALQRQLAAAGQQGDDARANIGTQAGLGELLRQIQASQGRAGIDALSAQTGLFGGLPLDLLRGSNSTGSLQGTEKSVTKSSGLDLSTLITAASLAAAPFTGGASLTASMGPIVSDRRAKTGIRKVGKLDNGLPVYSYRYKTGGPRHIGVMAQEAQKVKPEAVANIGGLLAVDYGKL